VKVTESELDSIFQALIAQSAPNVYRLPRRLKVLSWVGGLLVVAAIICLLFSVRLKSPWLGFVGNLLMLFAQLDGLVLISLPIIEEVQRLKRMSGSFFQNRLQACAKYAEEDRKFAEMLSRSDESTLRFAGNRLRSDADGIKWRTALMVGALEKIGVLPLLASIAYTYLQLKGRLPSGPYKAVYVSAVVGYLVLVFGGSSALFASDRLDYLAGVVDLALLFKEEKPGKTPV